MSANFKRHVGRIKNTDRRCAVVYPQIPGAEEFALIVDTDALPDFLHETLVSIIDSSAGQDSLILADVLSRRSSPDSGYDMLNSLHARALLQKQKITNIMMYPQPNAPVELSVIVDMINKGKEGSQIKREDYEASPGDRFKEKLDADTMDSQKAIAIGLLKEADMLVAEANNKRARAYKIAPNLAPKGPVKESAKVTATEADNQSKKAQEDSKVVSKIEEAQVNQPVEEFTEVFDIDIIDDPSLDPEMRKVLQQAKEHLARSAFREDNNIKPVQTKDSELTEGVKEPSTPKPRKRAKKAS